MSIESPNQTTTVQPPALDDDLPRRLAAALGAASADAVHSGFRRAGRMSPELSYGRHAGPAPVTARAAAVMLLLFRRGGEWRLPLTQRPAALVRHCGQISLPGGRIEAGETSAEAAERELREELGIRTGVQRIGRLPDRYVYASDYVVTPHVAVATSELDWKPEPCEVERVVELPIDRLLSPATIGRMTIHRGPLVFHAPCYILGEDRIWGATAVILAELADMLHREYPWQQP